MLDPLYWLAAHAIVFFHKGFAPIFGASSFFAWAFSVVLLVVVVRILIFPLFVKQVKSQRKMQMMQPLIKEIKDKWGHDKQRMQQEMLNLQREHGNPLLGCLPILLQIPLFIALFHVFNSLQPVEREGKLTWVSRVDLPWETVRQIAEAKLLGISLSSSFTSGADYLSFIQADGTNVKIAAVVLIVLMGTTTFLTQKQIMARTGRVDPQQAMIQKFMLYGSPIMLAVFGFRFPIAVLLYWLTTNLWSLGQQFFVIKKMPPLQAGSAGGTGAKVPGARPAPGDAAAVSRPKPGVKPQQGPKRAPAVPAGSAPGTPTRAGGAAATRGGTRSGPERPEAATSGKAGNAGNAAGTAAGTGNVRGTSPRRGSGAAPPGTRSPRGAASGGAAAGKDGGNDKGAKANGKASGKGVTGQPDSAGAAASDEPGSAQPASRNGSSPTEPRQRPTSPPVGAGARRQPAGSRPVKRRGKNKRPGGRR